MMAEALELWRVKRVAKETTLSVATIWRWSGDDRFPCPRRIGANAVAWRSDEVREWMESRPQVGKEAA